MARRIKVGKKYSKKLFRRTAGKRSKKQITSRPHQRGGWRM